MGVVQISLKTSLKLLTSLSCFFLLKGFCGTSGEISSMHLFLLTPVVFAAEEDFKVSR